MVFSLFTDLRVGFEATTYSVLESAHTVEVAVVAFGNKRLGKPFGVRVITRDESAVGKLAVYLRW